MTKKKKRKRYTDESPSRTGLDRPDEIRRLRRMGYGKSDLPGMFVLLTHKSAADRSRASCPGQGWLGLEIISS